MDSNPYAQPGPYDQADLGIPMEPARTSVLAILSLISSLICCIPGLGLLGSALGIGAIIGISSSRGRVGGKGLAIAGTVIGLLFTAIWLALVYGGASIVKEMAGWAEIFNSAQQRDYAYVRDHLDSNAAALVTDEMIDEFAESLDAEWGGYVDMPDSMIELVRAFVNDLDPQAMQEFQRVQSGLNIQGDQAIPLPIEFDKGRTLCLLAMNGKQSGPPRFQNVGFLDQGLTWVWLIPIQAAPPVTAPPSAPPATTEPAADAPAEGEAEQPDGDASGESPPAENPDQPAEPEHPDDQG